MTQNKIIRVREPGGCLSSMFAKGKQHRIQITPRLAQAAEEMVRAHKIYQFSNMVQFATMKNDMKIKAGGIQQDPREHFIGLFDEAERVIEEELGAQGIPSLSTAFIYAVAKTAIKEVSPER
jgi:hypothetical protein